MHTIKITPNLLFVYKRQIYQIAESNRIEIFLARIGMLYYGVDKTTTKIIVQTTKQSMKY